jgi:hypothetical protein
MHLYSAALAAEHLRAVEATLREPEAAPPELSEIADSASSLVRNVNRCVLQRDRGIMSMAEYARCLADATAGTDDESLISELLETEAR